MIPLSNTLCVFADEFEKFKKFTDEVTGLKERRDAKLASSKKEESKKEVKKKK